MEFSVLVFLYGIIGVIEMVAYGPQIIKLAIAKDNGNEVSPMSWFLWLSASIVGTAYALIHVKDLLLTLVTAGHVLGCGLILGLALYNKHMRFNNIPHNRRSSDRPTLEGTVQLPHEAIDVAETPSYMQSIDDHEFSEFTHH